MSCIPVCPDNLTPIQIDEFWMAYALKLAEQAEAEGEVPVGAVLVKENQWFAEGFNQPIKLNDPTAHAEVLALRAAGQKMQNYRMLDLTLYVTLEPCPMCATALVHARVKRIVYGAKDLRTGAVDSVFNLTSNRNLNHHIETRSSVLESSCSLMLSQFFKKRRAEKKKLKINKSLSADA